MILYSRAIRWAIFIAVLLLAPLALRTERSTNHLQTACPEQSAEVNAFCTAIDGEVSGVLVELQSAPTAVFSSMIEEMTGERPDFAGITEYAIELVEKQDAFIADLQAQGIPAVMRRELVTQIDGSQREVEFRFTYLRNGMVVFVPTEQIAALQAHPDVTNVEVLEPVSVMLDKAIDYSLGSQPSVADRRSAVYGATEELTPAGALGHPEAPDMTTDDGVEGQGMIIAVIDTGVDYRHPAFGGTGQTTPLPRLSGNAPAAGDNQKVIYYYSFSNDAPYFDDFGHGTHVAADAAAYLTDGNTPAYLGFGTGYDNLGAGPTPGGVSMHGTAPQAQIMAYKVCNIAGNCLGETELSIEDAASPYTLATNGTITASPKPVADVINLSLGSASGDADSTTSVAVNNAALMGSIVVASAGNDGPGPGTIGAPSAATLAISVGASLDPGSVAGADVLAADEVADDRTDDLPGPLPETGATSEANATADGERTGMKMFPVAGGGPLPEGSVSAHLAYVDLRDNPAVVPPEVTNRIAVVQFTGAFAGAANAVAPSNPAAILLVTATESATAVQVINDIPTYTLTPANSEYVKQLFPSYTPPEEGSDGIVTDGDISTLPLRLGAGVSLPAYEPAMAGFSSRGPNDHPDAGFRVIKPDVTAPGVGVLAAATVDGNAAAGMAEPKGYINANGTSFSGPITAGALVLIRQHVRDYLGFDALVPFGDDYTAQIHTDRFEAVTLSRALLMNNATNLRTGIGAPDPDANSRASINDQGAGHIDISGALMADAVMLAPTLLLEDGPDDPITLEIENPLPDEYTPGVGNTSEDGGSFDVLLPSVSFAEVPIAGSQGTRTLLKEVTIRDIITPNATGIDAGRNGAGTYDLSFADNRNLADSLTQVSFTSDAAGNNLITSITVPDNGEATFYVKVVVDGQGISLAGTEVMWYVYAQHQTSGKNLRMPFYFRAADPIPSAPLAAPVQADISDTENVSGTLPVDQNGVFTLNWSYDVPEGGATPTGFQIEQATLNEVIFSDPADETLVGGGNSNWDASPQWSSGVNPDSADTAYFVPSGVEQFETLTLADPLMLPEGGATLSFDSNIQIEEGFDFGRVEVSTDNVDYAPILTLDVDGVDRKSVDLSSFTGGNLWIRFVLITDMLPGGSPSEVGWYVENIEVAVNNYEVVKTVGMGGGRADFSTSITQSGATEEYFYRIKGLFDPADETLDATLVGPHSNDKSLIIANTPTQVGLSQNEVAEVGNQWVLLVVTLLLGATVVALHYDPREQ